MNPAALERIRDVIQEDVNGRGLRTDAERNLINSCPNDFANACRHLAQAPNPIVTVFTGFFIPHANPPAAETDGPLGALFLARALTPLGIHVALAVDSACEGALQAGLAACSLAGEVPLVAGYPASERGGTLRKRFLSNLLLKWRILRAKLIQSVAHRSPGFGPRTYTHFFVSLEHVGPSHTLDSLRAQAESDERILNQFQEEVPEAYRNRCHTMSGRDISEHTYPAHRMIETAARAKRRITTIGIGDGGNEIGMGKIPWDVIRRNIPNGGLIACRVPTDYLIVCGVSNWGAYGLAAGVTLVKGKPLDPELFDPERERELLRIMVEQGPLVDGVTGRQTVTVDGLDFDRYAAPLRALRGLAE